MHCLGSTSPYHRRFWARKKKKKKKTWCSLGVLLLMLLRHLSTIPPTITQKHPLPAPHPESPSTTGAGPTLALSEPAQPGCPKTNTIGRPNSTPLPAQARPTTMSQTTRAPSPGRGPRDQAGNASHASHNRFDHLHTDQHLPGPPGSDATVTSYDLLESCLPPSLREEGDTDKEGMNLDETRAFIEDSSDSDISPAQQLPPRLTSPMLTPQAHSQAVTRLSSTTPRNSNKHAHPMQEWTQVGPRTGTSKRPLDLSPSSLDIRRTSKSTRTTSTTSTMQPPGQIGRASCRERV